MNRTASSTKCEFAPCASFAVDDSADRTQLSRKPLDAVAHRAGILPNPESNEGAASDGAGDDLSGKAQKSKARKFFQNASKMIARISASRSKSKTFSFTWKPLGALCKYTPD